VVRTRRHIAGDCILHSHPCEILNPHNKLIASLYLHFGHLDVLHLITLSRFLMLLNFTTTLPWQSNPIAGLDRSLEVQGFKIPEFRDYRHKKQLRWSRGCVLAYSTLVRGFKPGRSRRIFQGEKIPSTHSFGGEVQPAVPCRRFAACKRNLNVTWKSAFRQNSRILFLVH
jgi:hypothetical protein